MIELFVIASGLIKQSFNTLFNSFCKVEFLCYAGEPNWLGWLVLLFFALAIGGFLLFWLFYSY
jgi:hypothetical protein